MHVAQPLKTNQERGIQRLKKLFQCVALRRTKDAVKNELKLPVREIKVHHVEFSPQEHAMYCALRRSSSYVFCTTGMETDQNKFTTGILPTITRLRRFCNHNLGLLSQDVRSLMEGCVGMEKLAQALTHDLKTCDVCSNELSRDGSDNVTFQTLQCGHNICSRCVQGQSVSNQSCPLCFGLETSLNQSDESDHEQPQDAHSFYQPSSKVLAMLRNISAEQAAEPGVKWSAGSQLLSILQLAC